MSPLSLDALRVAYPLVVARRKRLVTERNALLTERDAVVAERDAVVAQLRKFTPALLLSTVWCCTL